MAQSLTSAEILAQLEVNTIDFVGNISEIEGLSSDEDDENFNPMPEEEEEYEDEEEEEEGHSSDGQPGIVDERNNGAQNRNPPPWRHTNDFQPLPPAPAFEEGVWEGKEQDPHEYFLRYIPTEFFDSVSCANQNCLARKGKSLNTTAQEIRMFFGISITMSYLRFPRISMYWAVGTRVAKIADKMSRKRFFSIRSNLKVVVDSDISDDTRSVDKFWKVRPLLHLVREGCLQNPRTQRVAIDEQMVPFWGHTSARQYVRGKPNPCGLKNFLCASPDGLPLDFFMEGKGDTIIEQYDFLGIGGIVVIRLAKSLPEGCIIYMDSFFTSVELLDCLHSDAHCQGTGTIQKSRIPHESTLQTDSEMQRRGRGAVDQSVRGDGQISVVKWFDNKSVVLASSVEGELPIGPCWRWSKRGREYITVNRPDIVKKYNEHMGGVDLLDRVIALYRQDARTRKWTVRLIFHFIDFVCAAAWLEYRRDSQALKMKPKDTLDYLQFKASIADWLLHFQPTTQDEDEAEEEFCMPLKRKKQPTPHPSKTKRTNGASHMPEFANDEKNHRCRLPGCKSVRARWFCSECNLHFCLVANRNCFKAYHRM